MKDLHVSKKTLSYFFRVSKTEVMFVEVLPFLTQSQVDTGFSSSWFSQDHLQELVSLLKSRLTDFSEFSKLKEAKVKDSSKIKRKSKDFVLSGDLLRAACNFKSTTETNYYVLPVKLAKPINSSENRFQEIKMLDEKLVIYVCPKSSSSVLQLSQLLSSDKEKDDEDISKYFPSIPSKELTK